MTTEAETMKTKNEESLLKRGNAVGARGGGSMGFWLLLLVVVGGGTAGLVQRWLERMELRREIDVKRIEAEALGRLQAENLRLKGQQIPAAELEALRADHAAVGRLKAELEALKGAGGGRTK